MSDQEDTERRMLLTPYNNNNRDSGEPTSPADKVRYILFEDPDDGKIGGYRSLFCQLDVLCHFPNGSSGWKETSRWLKYEERVDDGNRWSKPHVSTTSLHSIFEVRRYIAEKLACVQLDLDAAHGCSPKESKKKKPAHAADDPFKPLPTIDCSCTNGTAHVAESVSRAIGAARSLTDGQVKQIQGVLNVPHKHQHRGGKTEGKASSGDLGNSSHAYPTGMNPDSLGKHKANKKFGKKLVDGTESVNIMVGHVSFLESPVVYIGRLKQSCVLGDSNEVNAPTRFVCVVLGPSSAGTMVEYEEIGRAVGGLFADKVFAEVAYKAKTAQDLLDGMDEYIDGLTVLPPSVWDPSIRLEPPTQTLTDAKLQNRLNNDIRYEAALEAVHAESHDDPTMTRTGRLFGGMWNDMKRRYPQYLTDITDGIHIQCFAAIIFLYFACITPIITFGGLMGSSTDQYMGTMESLLSGAICGLCYHTFSGQPLTIVGATGPLLVFESIMYTLCKDYEWDFLSFRFYTGAWICIILLLIVAFDLSALVAYITRFTEESFSVLISLIFIAEAFKKVKGIWKTHPVHVGPAREDIGYVCHCVESVFTNGSEPTPAMMTIADGNGTYFEPVKYMWDTFNRTVLIAKDCVTVKDEIRVTHNCISEYDCEDHYWDLQGPACWDKPVTHGIPDVFLMSCFLFASTFGIAYTLRIFRNSNFFPSFFRNTVADFAVLCGILISVGVDYAMGLNTPKLQVPAEFKTSRDDRGWFVNPGNITVWWLIPLSIVPAILATILIFLDQQITAVIVNRKEHKLVKGHGYHLDLFVLSFLILVCSFLGLPWFVAATVRSITHVKALLRQEEHTAPGEKPKFLGVREQRLTGICIHILIGVSVLLTPILNFVPMPVLYGVFLYMGVTSLSGVQFFERIQIMFMPAKYQPDYVFLRHVPIKRVHIFTIIQVVCMIIMWTLKSIKAVSITFPLMVLALCFIRKGMEKFFSINDLFWLDHLLPEINRRNKEDAIKDQLNDSKDVKLSEV